MLFVIALIIAVSITGLVVLWAVKVGEAKEARLQEQYLEEVEQRRSTNKSTLPSDTIFTTQFPIKGIKDSEELMEFATYNDEIRSDYDTIKMMYERGERIYEYEFHVRDDVNTPDDSAEKIDVLIGDFKVGYINAKDSEEVRRLKREHQFVNYYIEGEAGEYLKIVRNENYDKDFDSADERNWVDRDELAKPKLNLVVRYRM